jgi:hypothetical protein
VLHSVAADDGQLQNRFCALHVCVSDDDGTRLRLPFHVWFECRMVVRTGAATTRASRLHSNDALHRDQRSKGMQCWRVLQRCYELRSRQPTLVVADHLSITSSAAWCARVRVSSGSTCSSTISHHRLLHCVETAFHLRVVLAACR